MTNNSIQVFKGGWEELQNAVFTDNQSLISSSPKGHFIKPDGTALFVTSGDVVEKYPMSIPWDVNTLGAIVDTFTITEDADPHGIDFKPDGTKMIIVGNNTSILYEYTLVTPWEPSSIIAAPVTLSLLLPANSALECRFSRDGDFVFVTDDSDVNSFPLPTPYDITSNVSTTTFAPVLSGDVDGIAFKPEGDKMYLIDDLINIVIEYDLSPVYDITSAIPSGNTFTFSTIEPASISFRGNGVETFILDFQNSEIFRFHLDEAWDISTASLFTNAGLLSNTNSRGINWKPDGTKFFIIDTDSNDITEYTVTVPWNPSTPILGPTFSVAFLDTNPSALWWRPDGTRCYFLGVINKTLFQLNASTPWDVSTLSDSTISFDLTPQIGTTPPTGLYIRADGLKYYISLADDDVIEFDMTIPYDITSSVFQNTVFVGQNGTSLHDVFLKSDGKQLYTVMNNGDFVNRHVLSIPWDITSAVFTDFLDISNEETSIFGLFIRQDDGKKLYIVGSFMDTVFCYNMSLEFNNSIITNFGEDLITNAGELLVQA